MANLKGFHAKKGVIGGNTLADGDSISGLIVATAKPDNLEFDTPIEIRNVKSAENYGITAEFDEANNVNTHRHISEFYRMAGEGKALHVMIVDNTTTMEQVCSEAAKVLLANAKGEIRQLAVAVNPSEAGTMLNGLPEDVFNSIPAAQGLADWAYDHHMPTQVFLEGYSWSGNASASANLREIENVIAPKVSVFIGQDYLHAKKKTGQAQHFADVGTLLGVAALAKVNQNVGNNELFNLSGGTSWLEPGLSSHIQNTEVLESLQTLEDKGYLFGLNYTGMAGVRINNDHVCVEIIVDSDGNMNEHKITYGRVMDKAVRLLRSVYLPKVKTDWLVDRKTGKLAPGTIIALEDIGDAVFEDMEKRKEITYGKAIVDKDSDLLGEKILKVSYKIVPKGEIGEIQGIINLKIKS